MNPGAIFLQETKVGRVGTCRRYEHVRSQEAIKGVNGGGLALGILNSLDPSFISEGDDDAEALTVEIWVGSFPIRLICGYGPQE